MGAVIASLDLNISQSESKSSLQTMVQNSKTYGFAYKGKIYLNPDVMNSEAAVHEYTHLWDNYTQKTNPELWNKGLNIFKGTSLWNEVVNDTNYSDIKDNENLVLSECHSRICGKIADNVLQKIIERDGNLKKADMVDWDKEVMDYIYNSLHVSVNHKMDKDGSLSYMDLKEFLSQPMKDFIKETKITKNTNESTVINFLMYDIIWKEVLYL